MGKLGTYYETHCARGISIVRTSKAKAEAYLNSALL